VASGRIFARILLAAVFVAGLLGSALPVAASDTSITQAQKIVQIAENEVGHKWAFKATGPTRFDCSGLVTYVFREAGLLDLVGGKRRTVRGFHAWFKRHGRANMKAPKVGDLVVWGRNRHVGIYVGNGRAVSALYNPYGVTDHKLSFITNMRVTAYLHVKLQR
jgi:cell wall-associated NlpC family hydrolase